MKKISYTFPKSSFLSVEKDMNIIVDMMFKNERLKKLLYYNSKDCLDKPNLTEEQTYELFGKYIKIVPKIDVDNTVMNYIIISFNNFVDNGTNPEFRDNIIEIDIICHFDNWHLKDFELRPYKIAAEIDSMLNTQKLTGIGSIGFIGSRQMLLSSDYAGICLIYEVIHGEEDKKGAPNPADEQDIIENFNKVFNNG